LKLLRRKRWPPVTAPRHSYCCPPEACATACSSGPPACALRGRCSGPCAAGRVSIGWGCGRSPTGRWGAGFGRCPLQPVESPTASPTEDSRKERQRAPGSVPVAPAAPRVRGAKLRGRAAVRRWLRVPLDSTFEDADERVFIDPSGNTDQGV